MNQEVDLFPPPPFYKYREGDPAGATINRPHEAKQEPRRANTSTSRNKRLDTSC